MSRTNTNVGFLVLFAKAEAELIAAHVPSLSHALNANVTPLFENRIRKQIKHKPPMNTFAIILRANS